MMVRDNHRLQTQETLMVRCYACGEIEMPMLVINTEFELNWTDETLKTARLDSITIYFVANLHRSPRGQVWLSHWYLHGGDVIGKHPIKYL